jgi:hypothetical protein
MAVIEAAVAIVEQDQVVQRPMAAFRQDDVGVTVAIQIADAGVRRGFSNAFSRNTVCLKSGAAASAFDAGARCSPWQPASSRSAMTGPHRLTTLAAASEAI